MTDRNDSVGGRELRQARRLSDLSQEQVAAALGVNRSRIATVEQFSRVPASFAVRYLRAIDELTQPDAMSERVARLEALHPAVREAVLALVDADATRPLTGRTTPG